MHKDWCGKPCSFCEHPCTLDETIYCSPDCENLGPNGEMDYSKCKDCDAYYFSMQLDNGQKENADGTN
jgi:hypothetical protein